MKTLKGLFSVILILVFAIIFLEWEPGLTDMILLLGLLPIAGWIWETKYQKAAKKYAKRTGKAILINGHYYKP